jgi:hypothetical protein
VDRSGDRAAAADRARWLAELAEAVDHAQRWSLSASAAGIPEVKHLYRRLDALRVEIEDLRRGRRGVPPNEIDPLWTNLFNLDGR